MKRIDLQLFGGRGSSSGGGGGGGGGGGDLPGNVSGGLPPSAILGTRGLSNERERYAAEVDEVLKATRQMSEEWGTDTIPEDVQIAKIKKGVPAMAYYDSNGNLAINEAYFNNARMTQAYDNSVANKFHPGRGNKTAMEAVAAHEYGHRIADVIAQKEGKGSSFTSNVEAEIVNAAVKRSRAGSAQALAKKISGYAGHNNAECIAEAVADVYCNGSKASSASKAVVRELKSRLNP